MEKVNYMKIVIGGTLTGIIYFLGGWDIALQTLMIAMLIDYITGFCKAGYEGKLNSKIGAKGIIKKVGYLLIVAVAVLIDRLMGDTGAVRTTIIYIFSANELLSIVENWAMMKLPIPKILINKLEQLKENEEER